MNKRPIIGIVGKVEPPIDLDLWNRITLADEFRYLVVKHGAIAMMLLPTEATMEFNQDDIKDNKELTEEEKEGLYTQMEFCDGYILQGGLCSCNYEIEIAKKAIELDKPVIGICAGFNNILRALGTDVMLDETKSHDIYDVNYRHKVNIQKDTMLYSLIGKEQIDVNSIHSMIAPKHLVEAFAKISSFSEDGLVESFEVKNKKFVMGIKWHPELLLQEKYVDNIFEKFVSSCKE